VRGIRRFFWLLVILLLVFVSQAAAVEIIQVGKTIEPHPNTGEEFIILISDNFWNIAEIQEAIERYQADIYQHCQVGSRVFAVTSPCFKDNYYGTGGDLESSEQIRDFLSQQYWEKGIIGAVLIGDISFIPMWYRPYNNGWLSQGPCEIFFADLDYDFSSRLVWKKSWEYSDKGTWYLDFDVVEGFSSYDGKPEIWISRIIPPSREIVRKVEEGIQYCVPTFEERVEMLLRFFEKDHQYWEGKTEYRDLAYFVEEKEELGGCDDYYWPIFPECQVNRRIWCSNCNKKDDYFNLPETKLIYFSAHGSPFGISMCPESPDPDEISLDSPDIYYSPVPVNIVIADSCNTFDFSIGALSVGQAFIFGSSDAVSGIGLGVAGSIGKIDSRPYSSILSLGEIWKGVTSSWTNNWNGIELVLMGDPFVKVARKGSIISPTVTYASPSCDSNGKITIKVTATDNKSKVQNIGVFITTKEDYWKTYDLVGCEWIGAHQGTRTFTYQGQPGKTYYLQINASNEAGLTSVYGNNPYTSGEGVIWTYRVIKATCPEVDTDIGPIITIDCVSCSRTITVKAEAEDPSGIVAMTIFKKRSDQSSFEILKECGAVTSCEASFDGELGEVYDIHVHAIDGDGNLSIKGTTVTCHHY